MLKETNKPKLMLMLQDKFKIYPLYNSHKFKPRYNNNSKARYKINSKSVNKRRTKINFRGKIQMQI